MSDLCPVCEARADALGYPPREPSRQLHKPGEHHRYQIHCEVCGQQGTIRLSIDPDLAIVEVNLPEPVA